MGSIEGAKAENGVAAPACNGGDQRNGCGGAAVTDGEAEAGRKGKAGAAVALPLEVGTRVMCRWRDQKLHPVKVIERRKIPNAGPNDYEYYVHYTECEFFHLVSLFSIMARVRVRVRVCNSREDWVRGSNVLEI